jgi:hypothetical protein
MLSRHIVVRFLVVVLVIVAATLFFFDKEPVRGVDWTRRASCRRSR